MGLSFRTIRQQTHICSVMQSDPESNSGTGCSCILIKGEAWERFREKINSESLTECGFEERESKLLGYHAKECLWEGLEIEAPSLPGTSGKANPEQVDE